MARRRPAARTSGSPAPRCSTGRSPATTAAPSCSASRTPTPRATPRSPTTALIDVMRWLGLDWDEGPRGRRPVRAVPAVRAQRHLRRRRSRGCATAGHLRLLLHQRRGRRAAQGRRLQGHGVRRLLPRRSTDEQVAAFEAEGRQPVVRFRMPDGAITFDDLVRGEITFQHRARARLRARRANGDPLYTLVNPVDDALMGITHVLRGEDLLSARRARSRCTTRSIELGIAEAVPRFGHLPYVMGEGNKKLSKRDPQAQPARTTATPGSCPRACSTTSPCWAGRSPRTATSSRSRRWSRRSTIARRQPQPRALRPQEGRGDQRRAHAAARSARTSPTRLVPYLIAGDRLPAEPDDAQFALVRAAAPLVQERSALLPRPPTMLGFLFIDEDRFVDRPRRRPKVLTDAAAPVLAASIEVVEAFPALADGGVREFAAPALEAALKAALVEGLGLKPRVAFAPVRVAVTGRTVSPPALRVDGAARPGRVAGPATRRIGGRGGRRGPVTWSARACSGRPTEVPADARRELVSGSPRDPLGYGVIGNTADSGSAILGSSPSTPACSPRVACT